MDHEALLLSRLQFAANISFHILFPTITVGLSWILLFFRTRFTLTGDQTWEYAYQFWVKIFALTFALGVVSGITMSFQFGTNWPGFMERAGNIAGPLLGYEVLTAFFMEASFLGVMLFGKDRVSNGLHLFACAVVAVGTCFSAFWILSLNSWMHTPAGYRIEDGVFYVANWWDVIFNPSFPVRFVHMINASLLTAAFLIAGISAWRVRGRVDGPATWLVLKTGVVMAAVLAPLQIFLGDLHGLNTLEHQPAKIAAMEAVWETERAAPFTLLGWPDESTGETRFAVRIPYAASLILTHDANGEVRGLNEFEGRHPPVAIVFWSFRVMVGMGVLMCLVAFWCAWELWRQGTLGKLPLTALSWMTFSGWIAVLAGWYVTEVGRQPWIIQGLLRADEVVASHPGGTVLGTLVAWLVLYVFLLVSYIGTLRYLSRKPARSLALLHEYGTAKPDAPAGAA
ncbi:MAG: cytochrome ubiquinol oxidase subunit I [Pseudomonadales bacterium]|nr:cytochrome ubiquinol oxidase subunit I [Pseudomonadales bacterium]